MAGVRAHVAGWPRAGVGSVGPGHPDDGARLPRIGVPDAVRDALPDGPERQAAIDEAKRLVVAYLPFKIHVHRIFTDLAQPWVVGYDVSGVVVECGADVTDLHVADEVFGRADLVLKVAAVTSDEAKRMPPGIPSPPLQIWGILTRSFWNELQSVATWYSLAPMTPAITAHTAIALASSRVPAPVASSRRPVNHTAAITPSAIIKP